MIQTTATEAPRVWVGCLAAYNAGTLYGEWVDVPTDADELREEIARILASSPEPNAEEWGFFDNEYLPAYLSGEYADIDGLCEYADELESADANGVPAYVFQAACEDVGETVNADSIMTLGSGEIRDWADVAIAASEEWGDTTLFGIELPGNLAGYIDWHKVGQDIFKFDGWDIADGIAYRADA